MNKKINTISYYDQYSKNYDSFYSNIQKHKMMLLMSYMPKSELIFDLGGGTGIFSEFTNVPVINIDISSKMIRFGLKTRKYLSIAADLEFLPIRKNSINSFVSFTAYQNTKNLNLSIKKLKITLTDNSKGILTLLTKSQAAIQIENIFSKYDILHEKISTKTEDISYLIEL